MDAKHRSRGSHNRIPHVGGRTIPVAPGPLLPGELWPNGPDWTFPRRAVDAREPLTTMRLPRRPTGGIRNESSEPGLRETRLLARRDLDRQHSQKPETLSRSATALAPDGRGQTGRT